MLLLICTFFVTCTERYWTACMDSKSATPFDWCCRVCTVTEVCRSLCKLQNCNTMEGDGTFRVSCKLCSTLPPYALPLCTGTYGKLTTVRTGRSADVRCAPNAPGCAKCRTDQLSASAERKPSGSHTAVGESSLTRQLPNLFAYMQGRRSIALQAV